MDLQHDLDQLSYRRLRDALRKHGGDRGKAAKALGLHRSRFYRLLARWPNLELDFPPKNLGRPAGIVEKKPRETKRSKNRTQKP